MSSEHTTGDHCPDCFNAGYDARDQRAESRTVTTEKVKHTDGPWYVSDMGICDSESCDVLCRDNQAESDANARLIAASPEMLSALELAEATIMRLDRHAPGAQQGTLDVVRAAIRRAKGD